MPTPYIKKIAKSKGMPISKVEKVWEDAKEAAKSEGKADNYGYVTSIFQSMIGASINAKNDC